ncbi:MAG: very short patch repair endonuclease [Bacteroidota bacterium]
MDKLTKDQRRKNMQAVKQKDSKIESLLAKRLYSFGIRYRRNDNSVYGKPDISFKKLKIAVFCDSEFWHGKDWETKKYEIKSNQDFWYKKIESNILRDKEVNSQLSESGWKIIRFWGKDIEKKLEFCVSSIQNAIFEQKEKINDLHKDIKRREISGN